MNVAPLAVRPLEARFFQYRGGLLEALAQQRDFPGRTRRTILGFATSRRQHLEQAGIL